MSDKLVPKNPEEVMVIREIVPGVTTLSVPFLRGGLVKFGGRATIIKLTTGSLAVFSPVALTPSVQQTLNTLGNRVEYIAAPDLEHHIFLSTWAAAYPNAKLLAPEGLAEKRAKLNASDKAVTILPFSTIYTKASKTEKLSVSPEFDAEFDVEFVDAHPNKEIVFFHRPSRTLVEADLLFNLPATEQYSKTGEDASSGWASKLVAGLMNTKGDAKWQRRVQWYAFSSSDRAGFNQSIKRIGGWGFENLVPCHGDVILGEGKAVFERVFKWHLEGKK